MKNLLAAIFFLSTVCLHAQVDTVYTYSQDGKISSQVILSNGLREGEAKFYFPSGVLKESISYQAGKVEGAVNRYYENGQLKEFFSIQNGKLEGPKTQFDSTGKVTSDIFYSEGVRKIDEQITEAEEPSQKEEEVSVPILKEEKTIPPVREIDQTKKKNTVPQTRRTNLIEEDDPAFFLTADVPPEPVGGINAIQNKRVYPEAAFERGIEGVVEVRVLIDRFGETYFAEVVKGIGGGCDEAAEIAVYYARYKPAQISEKPVNSQMIIRVEFFK